MVPIPPPNQDDDEDVQWALSTASALWNRGEHVEALKFLRRAAETASDANADARALELFKAAAEVTAKVNSSSAPPPAPAATRSSYPQAAPAAASAPAYPQAPPDPARPPPPRKKAPPALPPRGNQQAAAPAPAPAHEPPRQPPVQKAQPAVAPAHAQRRADPAPQPRPAAGAPAAAPPQRQAAAGGRRAAPQAEPVPAEPPQPAQPSPSRRSGSTGLRLDAGRGAGRGAPQAASGAARASAEPAPQAATPSSRRPLFDDLEEDTRVLQGAGRGRDAVVQTLQAIVSTPAPSVMDGLTDETTPADNPLGMLLASDTAPGLDGATSPNIPMPRLATVPSLRVAVMSAGVPGEVRLVPLDGGGPAPPGAVVAMLVPLTVADGDEVAKLFGFFG